MADVVIRVRCDIELAPTARKSGYGSGIRPNHFIRELDYFVIGEVHFEGQEVLLPGEHSTARVSFVGDEPFADLVRPGFEWDICDGPRSVIGWGRVLEVLPDA